MSETAQSYDSYMDTLLAVLDEFRPKIVFEYGTGKSTQVISMYQSVESMTSVEHQKEYYERIIATDPNSFIILMPDKEKYVRIPSFNYDLIFIDGVDRNECMKHCLDHLSQDGIVMLHDAKRSEYIEHIKLYPYRVWTDDGHTVTLTRSESASKRLVNCLSSVQNIIGVKS